MLSDEDIAEVKKIMEDNTFPKYQVSMFLNGDRQNQIVVRSNDFAEFQELIKNAKKLIDASHAKEEVTVEPLPNTTKPASQTMVCATCGKPAELKSGEKNGRKWSGVFCSVDKTHVKWL